MSSDFPKLERFKPAGDGAIEEEAKGTGPNRDATVTRRSYVTTFLGSFLSGSYKSSAILLRSMEKKECCDKG